MLMLITFVPLYILVEQCISCISVRKSIFNLISISLKESTIQRKFEPSQELRMDEFFKPIEQIFSDLFLVLSRHRFFSHSLLSEIYVLTIYIYINVAQNEIIHY